MVAWSIRVENPYNKTSILTTIPKTPGRYIKTWIFISFGRFVSLFSGCKWGSMATLWHTSDNKEAVRSRISFWRIAGKPPKLHVIAWSTENDIPQLQDDDTFTVSDLHDILFQPLELPCRTLVCTACIVMWFTIFDCNGVMCSCCSSEEPLIPSHLKPAPPIVFTC